MPLAMSQRFCGCMLLETGFFILCTISILACLANITVGARSLPRNKERKPEDNLISLSMVMFSTLSTIANIVAWAGVCLRRPGYLQLSLVFNSAFIVCIFLVAIVTCLYSPELQQTQFLDSPANITAVIILMFAGFAYSVYYLMMVNTLYITMKTGGRGSAIPI